MALGTFTVAINGDQLGAGTEKTANIRVQFAGSGNEVRAFIKDADADKFVFPHRTNPNRQPVSLPYSLVLKTDVTSGVSTGIGYFVTVTTEYGGVVTVGPFGARPAGSTVSLVDLASDFEGQVAESIAVRAESAAADAATAAASVQREQPGGVAGLDGSGKVFEARIPNRLSAPTLEALASDATGHRLDGLKVDARRPQTLVPFGDSLTEQGGEIAATPDTRSFAAWTWANMLLNQAFRVPANLGIGGNTTSQILARIGDVLALDPGWVILTAGTNNMGVVGGVEQAKADIAAMLDIFDGAGIRVVLPTLIPRLGGNYTGTTRVDTMALNEWIRTQARERPGLIVVDFFAAVADGVNGNFQTSVYGFNPTTDGIHLSATGGYACGKMLAAALRPHIVTNTVPYSITVHGANLLTTASARPAGTGTSIPTGWSASGTVSGLVTWSDVNRTDGVPGQWKQVVLPSGHPGAATLVITANANVDGSRLAVGDAVNAILEYDTSAVETGLAVDAQGICLGVRAWNGSAFTDSRYAFNYFRGPNEARAGVLRTPNFTLPAGTTVATLYLELRGGQTFKFDRVGIYARDTYPV